MLSTTEIRPSIWRHTQPRVSVIRDQICSSYSLFSEPSVGELRYIARLNSALLPNEEPFGVVSNIGGGTVVEGEDVVSFFSEAFFQYKQLTHISSWSVDKREASSTRANGLLMTTFIVRTPLPWLMRVHLTQTGVSGSAHRVCMILNQYETSAGGPFHR